MSSRARGKGAVMADRVVLVLADGRTLAFDLEVYQSALVEGARLSGVPASPGEIASEPLLDDRAVGRAARDPGDLA